MKAKRRKLTARKLYPIVSWRPDRKATRGHIREAIRLASEDMAESKALLADRAAYARQCGLMQKHAEQMDGRTLRDVARQKLEYWRLRAFMPGAYGATCGGDRQAFERWQTFA